jgi:nickel/cobalt transporter (NicO) family protein
MTRRWSGGMSIAIAIGALAVAGALLVAGALDVAHAQGNPFGIGAKPPPPALGGFGAWIIAKQAEFYRALSGLIRAAKADGTAMWGLMGVSFAYGIFHAVGPGHGKAVISSYLVANEETWRRGLVLSLASAVFQACTAIAVVGVAAVLLGATARTMSAAVNWIETAGYALIVLIGARLIWVKGRGFLAALRKLRHPAEQEAANEHHAGHHHHDHASNCHAHHHHDDEDASAWGHAHAPEPDDLAGPGGWKRGLSAVVAVGLRPCSGAVIVLVFALAQGLFWAGVASTFVMGLGTAITVAAIATIAVGAKSFARRFAKSRSGYGMLAMRGLEVAASVAVLMFGLALLAGYMVSERMVGI